jgi:hypothetical protein
VRGKWFEVNLHGCPLLRQVSLMFTYILLFYRYVEEAIQLAYGMFVVLHSCQFVPEIMQERAPDDFLHQYSWKVAV